ncbi:hypothetical protein Ciccas_005911 [Cichlidogyrus casuarinus]|uniref:Uncharacterized protein n=1 Tax=Cichlidogyrus casuarinus TaxID=1844966 RepID=A0ABD2Q7B8_9PLAT
MYACMIKFYATAVYFWTGVCKKDHCSLINRIEAIEKQMTDFENRLEADFLMVLTLLERRLSSANSLLMQNDPLFSPSEDLTTSSESTPPSPKFTHVQI